MSRLLHRLEDKAVIEIDRHRTYCRYVFQEVWRGAFRPVPGRLRFASHANHDLRLTQITGEPGTENQYNPPNPPRGAGGRSRRLRDPRTGRRYTAEERRRLESIWNVEGWPQWAAGQLGLELKER